MKFDNKTLNWGLIGGLAISVIIFFAIMYEGLAILSAKSKQLVDLKFQSQTADAQLSNLERTKKDIEKYSYFKTVAQTVIPNDKDQATAVLELNHIAEQSGISLQSITFPTSNLGASAAAPKATASGSNSTSAAGAISQAKPVEGIPGLYSLQLTVTPDTSSTVPPNKQVTYAKMLDFLQRIENNRHTAQITQINIQPAANGTSLSFSLVINIFIKP